MGTMERFQLRLGMHEDTPIRSDPLPAIAFRAWSGGCARQGVKQVGRSHTDFSKRIGIESPTHKSRPLIASNMRAGRDEEYCLSVPGYKPNQCGDK